MNWGSMMTTGGASRVHRRHQRSQASRVRRAERHSCSGNSRPTPGSLGPPSTFTIDGKQHRRPIGLGRRLALDAGPVEYADDGELSGSARRRRNLGPRAAVKRTPIANAGVGGLAPACKVASRAKRAAGNFRLCQGARVKLDLREGGRRHVLSADRLLPSRLPRTPPRDRPHARMVPTFDRSRRRVSAGHGPRGARLTPTSNSRDSRSWVKHVRRPGCRVDRPRP